VDLAEYRDQKEAEERGWEFDLVIEDEEPDPTTPYQFTAAELKDLMSTREWNVVCQWLEAGRGIAVWRRQAADWLFESFVREPPQRPFDETEDSFQLLGVCQP
jgi:hypothetical protein